LLLAIHKTLVRELLLAVKPSATLTSLRRERPTMDNTLPVAGVWVREWEEDPLGGAADSDNDGGGVDRTTLVIWIQSRASGVYVDLRLPENSPGRSIEAARQLGIRPRPTALAAPSMSQEAKDKILSSSGEALDSLYRQKSFAGVLEYKAGDSTTSGEALKKDKILARLAKEATEADKGSGRNGGTAARGAMKLCTCFWRRDLDYQPPSGGLDVGVCASEQVRPDGSVLLRETGEDGSYAEGWLRAPDTERGPFLAMELVSENDGSGSCSSGIRRGYWVRVGNRFAYAVGRPISASATVTLKCADLSHEIATKVGKTLSDAIAELAPGPEKALDLLSSYVCVAGEVLASPDSKWIIHHSTNPELLGCNLVQPSGQNDDDTACSLLTGTGAVGDEIVQLINSDVFESSPTRRRWKILEMAGCSLPGM